MCVLVVYSTDLFNNLLVVTVLIVNFLKLCVRRFNWSTSLPFLHTASFKRSILPGRCFLDLFFLYNDFLSTFLQFAISAIYASITFLVPGKAAPGTKYERLVAFHWMVESHDLNLDTLA